MANKKYRVGLTIMRAQPLHEGHESIIRKMITECDIVVVLLGSAQESGTEKNPFTAKQRARMIKNIFGTGVLVAGIDDLGNIDLWVGYVLAHVWKQFHITPDVYYCGGEWDGPRFASAGLNLVNLDRRVIPISATEIRRDVIANLEYINKKNHKLIQRIINDK